MLSRRLQLGHDLQVGQRQFVVVGGLHQQAGADALHVDGVLALVPGAGTAGRQCDLQHAHIGLGLEHGQRFGRVGRRHQHLDELLGDLQSRIDIQRTVQRDDAAESRGRVGLEGAAVGVQRVRAQCHAAGVGVLHDDAGGRVKTLDAFPGGVGVGDVVVAQFLALQLDRGNQRAGGRVQVAVEGGLLVRVLAVAQVLQLDEAAVRLAGKQRVAAVFLDGRQVVADGAVVLADAVERGDGQRELGLLADAAAGLQLGQHAGVLAGVGQHRHVLPVLGGAAHHGRAADVDVLDCVFQRTAGLGDRGFKRVKIHHQQINGVNAVRLQRGHVLGQIAPRQQAAVDLGVQGLDAAVQHFRKAGQLGHFGHRQALLGQQLGGAAGGDELHAQGVQAAGQFDDTGLVGDGEQCVHMSLCSTSFLRKVLRFRPSQSAARDWLLSACFITTSNSGFSTALISIW